MREIDMEDLWSRRLVGGLFWILIITHAGLAGWIACRYQPSVKELTLLEAGVRILNERNLEFERTTPPLIKVVSALPVYIRGMELDWVTLKSEAAARGGLIPQTEFDMQSDPVMWNISICRFTCIVFSLLGMLYCYLWASDLFGTVAGLIAAALWGFSPGMIGHAGFISPDVAAASLAVMLVYHLRVWLLEPTYLGAIIIGVVSGGLVLTKLVLLSVYAMVPLICFIFLLIFKAGEWQMMRFLNYSLQLIFAFAISLTMLNAGYGFNGSLQELRDFEFQSEMPMSKSVDDHFAYTGNTLGSLIVPFPKEYVRSIDEWAGIVLGRQPVLSINDDQVFLTRIWYAFTPVAIRIPLAFVVLMLLALMWFFKSGNFLIDEGHSVSFLLLFPATLFLLLALLSSEYNDLYGDLLVCLPFLIIWATAPWFEAGDFPMSRLPKWFGYLMVLCFMGSSLHAFPHSRSFFNVAVGDVQNRHLYLKDASQDWGDDLLLLRAWRAQQSADIQLSLAYAGVLDPAMFEMQNMSVQQHADLNTLPPGWYAVSEQYVTDQDSPFHAFQQLTPKLRIGRSLLLYEMTPPPPAPEVPELRA